MKTFWGNVTVHTNTDEIEYINELIRRDRSVAPSQHKGKINDYYKCGKCRQYVQEDANFCQHCGQRIDLDNIAFL